MRLVTLIVLVALVAGCSRREQPLSQVQFPKAPVIVISIDTLRADHLPAYGYKAVETPAIDGLRRDSILFENAYAHVPLTLPSHVSMLTGQLPPDNGVRNNIGYPFDAAKHVTIPSLLHANGYATGAAVSAYVLRSSTGLGSAFDFYDDRIEVRGGEAQGEVQRPGDETAAIATRWIDERGDQPFFFLLHLYEPHAPWSPPEPYRSRFSLPYDGEIAAADAIVGRFLDELKAKKIYDRAVIILMSDHGEGLSEHGEKEHGIFVYREDLHVPLFVKLPKGEAANTTIKAPAALIDIFPTIASLTGIKPPSLRGISLLTLDAKPARSLYAESLYPRIHLGWSELRCLIDDQHHFIQAPRPELYDIRNDTAERKNILEDERRVYAKMKQDLGAYGSEAATPSRIDPEEAKKLAALGYLSSPAASATGPLPDPKDHVGEIELLSDAAHRDAAGDHEGAITAYRAILAKNPGFTDAWALLAKSQERSGRYADAIESYKRAIQASPTLAPDHALTIASLDLNLQRYDDADRNAALAEKSHPAEARVLMGRAALGRHAVEKAEQDVRAALAIEPDNPRAKILLAQVFTSERRFDEAMQIVDALARAQEGKQPIALVDYVRGDLFARTGHPDEAIAAFQREIRNFPKDRQTYGNLAVLYWFADRPADARRTMEELQRAVPGPESYRFAAETFQQIGAKDLAATFAKLAR